MKDVSEHRQREVETYFDVIARGGSDRLIRARSFHNLGEYTADDYARVSSALTDAGATGSFAFLGRDAKRYADTIAALVDDGHEIVLHGHRHVGCGNVSYEFAHDNLTRGLAAIEDAAGVTPPGFFPPLQTLNQAAVDAAADVGFEWLFGTTPAEVSVPDGVTLVEPHNPYDLVLLNDGSSPAETFERLDAETEPGTAVHYHPNMLEYYDALDEFETWVEEHTPVAISEFVDGDGVGLVLDAMRPLRIE